MSADLKKSILPIMALMALAMSLFVVMIFVGQKQDIRPRAVLTGNADLILTTDNSNRNSNEQFDVLASARLNDSSLRISGADFVILYDKNLLEAVNLKPNTTAVSSSGAFTDAPVVTKEGSYDNTYNFLRVAESAALPDNQLKGGTVTLAWITFRTKATGDANIKYSDKPTEIMLSGINIGSVSPTQ